MKEWKGKMNNKLTIEQILLKRTMIAQVNRKV